MGALECISYNFTGTKLTTAVHFAVPCTLRAPYSGNPCFSHTISHFAHTSKWFYAPSRGNLCFPHAILHFARAILCLARSVSRFMRNYAAIRVKATQKHIHVHMYMQCICAKVCKSAHPVCPSLPQLRPKLSHDQQLNPVVKLLCLMFCSTAQFHALIQYPDNVAATAAKTVSVLELWVPYDVSSYTHVACLWYNCSMPDCIGNVFNFVCYTCRLWMVRTYTMAAVLCVLISLN